MSSFVAVNATPISSILKHVEPNKNIEEHSFWGPKNGVTCHFAEYNEVTKLLPYHPKVAHGAADGSTAVVPSAMLKVTR